MYRGCDKVSAHKKLGGVAVVRVRSPWRIGTEHRAWSRDHRVKELSSSRFHLPSSFRGGIRAGPYEGYDPADEGPPEKQVQDTDCHFIMVSSPPRHDGGDEIEEKHDNSVEFHGSLLTGI